MALNDEQKSELATLISSQFFKSIELEVVEVARVDLQDSLLNAPELALALAYEKGVKESFRIMKQLTKVSIKPEPISHTRLK